MRSLFAWEKGKKTEKQSVGGPQLPALVERAGMQGRQEAQRRSLAEALTGAVWGKRLALRELWWCRNDIFRAAVRVIDEYQMLSITPWEKLITQR